MKKTILITGATSGIGTVTATELAMQGHSVIIAARNKQRARKTTEDIRQSAKHERVFYFLVDFSSQASIHRMVKNIRNEFDRLHILINNHGTINILRKETVDGLEETFAVNHLGYFLLTNLLLDRLKASGEPEDPARIINVASSAHHNGRIDFDNLQLKQEYSWSRAYGNSKLANILFTFELSSRLKEEGAHVTANALHPGWVATNIGADAFPIPSFLGRIGKWFINLTAISPEKGARTTIYLATSPHVKGVSGKYFYKSKPYPASKAARDKKTAQGLWEISKKLVDLD